MGEGFLGRGLSTYMLVEHLTCAADQELSGQWGRILQGQIHWIISQTVDTLVPRFSWWYRCERRERKRERTTVEFYSSSLSEEIAANSGQEDVGKGCRRDGRLWNFFQQVRTSHSPYSRGRNFLALGPCRPPQFLFTMLYIVSRLSSHFKCRLCIL